MPRRKVVEQLKELLNLRKRFLNSLSRFTKPIKELKSHGDPQIAKLVAEFSQDTIEVQPKALASIEAKIDKLIREDAQLSRFYQLITSVDGMGKVTAAQMIVDTNEFQDIREGKKFACHSGVVPFEHRSGSSVRSRSRVSHLANKCTKTLLHMAALSVIRMPGEFKDYYQRKVAEGKNKMSVINAIRNKIILRVFACLRDNRCYQKNYVHALA